MQCKILIILSISLLITGSAFAQAKSKYTPKLPNFFEGTSSRGDLIKADQIVATKVTNNNSSSADSFAVSNNNQNSLMKNPLGILPKTKPILKAEETKNEELAKDATTSELEQAVQEARDLSEEIRKNMGGNIDYTNPKDIDKFLSASGKAGQRGQLKRPNTRSPQDEGYEF